MARSRKRNIKTIEDLRPDGRNANRGTERGLGLLDQSLERFGAGRSVVVDRQGVVIAGNKTVERAAEKGFPVRVVETDGKELVVVQRKDLDLREGGRARELAIADNRISEIDLDWNPEALQAELDEGPSD